MAQLHHNTHTHIHTLIRKFEKTLYAGLLTQKLLHLLHAHVNVDTGAVVVVVDA